MRVIAAGFLRPTGGPGDLRCPDPAVLEETLGIPRPRRVGRLARLAAALALEVARRSGRWPRDDLAILMGCGLGNEAETQPVVERTVAMAMGLLEGPASPVHFANSVSNSTTFQVAQVLGAQGPNAVLSAEGHSFEAALWAASATLEDPETPEVLCGGFDEWTEPREGPLTRMGLPLSARLGEGGGWLWLTREPAEGPGRPLRGPLPGTIRVPIRLQGTLDREALDRLWGAREGQDDRVVVLAGAGIGASDLGPLSGRVEAVRFYLEETGHFPTAPAVAIASCFLDPETPALPHLHLARGPLGLVATWFRPGGARCG